MSIAVKDDRVLINCHRGCPATAIIAKLGIPWRDMFSETKRALELVDVYRYTDEQDHCLFEVRRYRDESGNKTFRQFLPDGTPGLNGQRRVPYHLPRLAAGIAAGRLVYLVEGERDVHSAEAAGLVATTLPGGASKQWEKAPDYWSGFFLGASVCIVADNDAPGKQFANSAATALRNSAASVAVVYPRSGKDLTDHLAAGYGPDELLTPVVTSTSFIPTWWSDIPNAGSLLESAGESPHARREAFQGVLGEAALRSWETSEAPPEAILLSLLTAAGSHLGSCRAAFGDTRYGLNLYSLIVGPSSRGRKGASWGSAKRIIDLALPDFPIAGGFGSGEALVDYVNNSSTGQVFLLEQEFARFLTSCNREGSSLSMVTRQAWDGERLQAISRTSTPTSTNRAHLSILGHLTSADLSSISPADLRNGLVNRFIFCASMRSRSLPLGTGMSSYALKELALNIQTAFRRIETRLAEMITPHLVVMPSPSVATRYMEDELAWSAPVEHEDLLGRFWPNLVRVACILALLDGRSMIEDEHYEAARAIMDFSASSVEWIFADAGDDDVRDSLMWHRRQRLLDAVCSAGDEGLTIAGQFEAVGRRHKAVYLSALADDLVGRGLVSWSGDRLYVTPRGDLAQQRG